MGALQTPESHPIVAVATAPGIGGVGIVRVSGTRLESWAEQILGQKPKPRYAHYTALKENGEPIDEGILLYYPAPFSYTGEDVLEFQGHGGPVVLQQIMHYFQRQGADLASPGEFTQRAFLNGKIDLAQAEAVADLIHAQSDAAARAAMGSLKGIFSEKINAFAEEMIRLRVLVESTIDFSEDVEWDGRDWPLADLLDRLGAFIQEATRSLCLQEGLKIALIGEPNVGKSSLLNALAGERRALVTDIPGTTRDVIRTTMVFPGGAVEFLDTAGLRETCDPVEQLGILWGQEERQAAHHVFWLKTEDVILPSVLDKWRGKEQKAEITWIRNKIDLIGSAPFQLEREWGVEIGVSAKTGAGMDLLLERVKALQAYRSGETVFLARQRHVNALREAQAALKEIQEDMAPEVKAHLLRSAHDALGKITGRWGVEALLGEIFSTFCIGK